MNDQDREMQRVSNAPESKDQNLGGPRAEKAMANTESRYESDVSNEERKLNLAMKQQGLDHEKKAFPVKILLIGLFSCLLIFVAVASVFPWATNNFTLVALAVGSITAIAGLAISLPSTKRLENPKNMGISIARILADAIVKAFEKK